MGPPGLTIQQETCSGVSSFGFSYDDGVWVGETWLVQTARLAEVTGQALPSVDAWIAQPSDTGALQPLAEGWLYNPGEPAYPNTFVATDLDLGVLERIQATYGQPATPMFVVPSWEAAQGERPWMIAAYDADPDVFGPSILRAYLGPGDAWLDGFATFLWQYVQMREGTLATDDYLDAWLADYSEHRRTLTGEPHRQSALAGRVKSICMLPSLGLAESRRLQHRLPEHEPLWLDERGVLDVRECLGELNVELAMIRYEDATPETLLRVRSAPGDPPTVERGGSFFQAGDVIIEVNHRRVQTRGDVAWALRDVPTGERFIVVVQRDGHEARTWATRPRVGDRDAVRFALVPVEVDES